MVGLCILLMPRFKCLENKATKVGGCVYYNKNRPNTINNTFESSNFAPYGSNFGGYPFTIKISSYDKIEIASGQKYEGRIIVNVLDADLILVNSDQLSNLKIVPVQENSDVGSKSQVQVKNGTGVFNDVKFIAKPGLKNVPFKIYSLNIDNEYLMEVLKLNSSTEINQEFMYFDFRFCVSGEIQYNNEQSFIIQHDFRCLVCEYGSYSLGPNSTTCKFCPDNAECPGGDVININAGFWRSSTNSTNIIECIEETACVGGSGLYNSTSQAGYPHCAIGYGGNLCQQCQVVNETKYTRIGLSQCGLCPSKTMNLIKLIGIMAGILIAVILLIYVNLRSKKESEASVTLRIFTNYIQIMTSASSYNLKWPFYLQKFFGIFSSVGEVAESFVSLDCFLSDFGYEPKTSSSFIYMKTLLIGILPIILMVGFGIIYLFFFIRSGVNYYNWKRQMIVSSLVVVYALLPTIQKYSFNLYFCMELDQNEYWLFSDLQIMCWTKEHMIWAFAIGTPMIVIWVVGFPLMLFCYLKRNQARLEDDDFFSKFRLIYQGLKQNFFFWEFINIFRKAFLMSNIVFLQIYPSMFKALLSLLILSVFLRLQMMVKPYKNPVINELEQREVMTSLITFFGGLFFVNKIYIHEAIQLIAFLVIVLCNLWFFIIWIYCFIKQFHYPKMQRFTKFLRSITLSSQLSKKEELFESNRKEQIKKSNDLIPNELQLKKSISLKVSSEKTSEMNQSMVALKPKSNLKSFLKKENKSISNLSKTKLLEQSNQMNEQTDDMSFFYGETKSKRGLLQSGQKLNFKMLTGQISSKELNLDKEELNKKKKVFKNSSKKIQLAPQEEEELKTEDNFEEDKISESQGRGNIAQPFEILDSIDQALPEGISIMDMKKQFIKSRLKKNDEIEKNDDKSKKKKRRRKRIDIFKDVSSYSVKTLNQKKTTSQGLSSFVKEIDRFQKEQ